MLDDYINKINVKMLNGSDLAYIGDAYYEYYMRVYLLSQGITKPNELHKKCTQYVCAKSHSKVIEQIYDKLSESEKDIYHRGKNYEYKHLPKSANSAEYLASSGFEALIGYLVMLKQNTRVEEILENAIRIIELKEKKNE